MTVSSTKFSIEHMGNGSVVSFPYDFRILDASHLKVYIDYVELTTGFTITGVDDQNGGEVIFNTAPTIGSKILLERDVPATQEVNYQAYDAFPAETHERALDKAMMVIQQTLDGRSVRLPKPIKPTQFNTHLPADIVNLGRRFLMTNENGNGFELLPHEFSFDGWLDRSESAASNAELFRNETQQFRNQTLGYRNEVSQWRNEAEELYQVERLFYISDDEQGVLVGVGVNTLVTETNDSIIVNLKVA